MDYIKGQSRTAARIICDKARLGSPKAHTTGGVWGPVGCTTPLPMVSVSPVSSKRGKLTLNSCLSKFYSLCMLDDGMVAFHDSNTDYLVPVGEEHSFSSRWFVSTTEVSWNGVRFLPKLA